MLTFLTLCVLGAGLGCTDEPPTAPRSAAPGASANTLITSDTLCARASFTITSATAVTTGFPNRTTCTTKLVLIRGQAATWAQNPNRRLRLFVRLLNKSGQTLQLPVRLYLAPTGTTVVAPAGTPASKVVPLLFDSTDASGGTIWFIGGTGTLAANDSTAQDTLGFNVQSPVTQARLQFQASAQTQSATVPAVAPDSTPSAVWASIHASGNLVQSDPRWAGPFPRNVLSVQFRGGTTQALRQSAIDLISGTVIGGTRIGQDEGYYYVQIVDDGTANPLFNAIATLSALPSVLEASPETPEISVEYLAPRDGSSWRTWKLLPDSADGDNWALERLNGPMAWGCSIGATLSRVGVVDNDFRALPEITSNLDLTSSPRFGQVLTAIAHGTKVASIIGAYGDDTVGMTGVMWRANMNLQEFSKANEVSTLSILKKLDTLAHAGVRVVNISAGLYWAKQYGRLPGDSAADSAKAKSVFRVFRNKLDTLAAQGLRPLVIFGASNDGPKDAWWSGTAQLASAFPSQVLIVGASTLGGGLAPYSNLGALVQLSAPGDQVRALDGGGSIVSVTGTSFAAPQVSGVAGLLLSFDSTYTAADLKGFLVGGAIRGGKTANGIPLLNAYESLKLAAERPGAPLCGNRVWSDQQGKIKVRRTASLIETIASVGDTAWAITPMHGGKHLKYTTAAGVGTLRWNAPTRTWLPETGAYSDTIPSGSARSFAGKSHDGDTTVTVSAPYPFPTSQIVPVQVKLNGGNFTTIDMMANGPRSGDLCFGYTAGGHCQGIWSWSNILEFQTFTVAYAPDGKTAWVAVNRLQNDFVSTGLVDCNTIISDSVITKCQNVMYGPADNPGQLYAVDLTTGISSLVQDNLPWTYWLGLSEGDNSLVLGQGHHTSRRIGYVDGSSTFLGDSAQGCHIAYRTTAFAKLDSFPTPDACRVVGASRPGGGVFAASRAGLTIPGDLDSIPIGGGYLVRRVFRAPRP